jgi:hypothetical protein
MPVPVVLTSNVHKTLVAVSAASITAGFSAAVACPTRGQILAVYLCPIDDSGTTGSATLTLTIAGTPSASVVCAGTPAGRGSGGTELLGPTANVNENDVVVATLPAGLVSAARAVLTLVVRVH